MEAVTVHKEQDGVGMAEADMVRHASPPAVSTLIKCKDGVSLWNIVVCVGVKQKSTPTPYPKCNVDNSVDSSWRVFINESMLHHIK